MRLAGVDVGSTTVKAVAVDPESRAILWSDYQRHETRQAEKVLELLVAVGQAAVSNLREGLRLGLSGGVVEELLADAADVASASPAERLPLGVPQLLVHGEDDAIVPLSMSRDYVEAARAAGDRAELVALPGVGHFEHLDPATEAWAAVVRWLS